MGAWGSYTSHGLIQYTQDLNLLPNDSIRHCLSISAAEHRPVAGFNGPIKTEANGEQIAVNVSSPRIGFYRATKTGSWQEVGDAHAKRITNTDDLTEDGAWVILGSQMGLPTADSGLGSIHSPSDYLININGNTMTLYGLAISVGFRKWTRTSS